MSAQVIELLLFACVAFFLVNKLLSVLGTTADNDSKNPNQSSFFGENTQLKDVTEVSSHDNTMAQDEIKNILVPDHYAVILQNFRVLAAKLPGFNLMKFVEGAKSAFVMLLDSQIAANNEVRVQLVDKRFLEQFEQLACKYGQYQKTSILDARISEIYMFGNNVFIKLLFSGQNITSKLTSLKEEWTFTKNTTQKNHDWYLSNIEIL